MEKTLQPALSLVSGSLKALSSLCGGACGSPASHSSSAVSRGTDAGATAQSSDGPDTVPITAPTRDCAPATRDSVCAWARGEGRTLSPTVISKEMVIVTFVAWVSTAQSSWALRCRFPKHPPTSCTWVKVVPGFRLVVPELHPSAVCQVL